MRVAIEDNIVRKEFFQLIKSSFGEDWKKIGEKFNILRQTFDCYRSGKTSMPEELFEKLVKILEEKSQNKFRLCSKRMPEYMGQIKGGKGAYKKNFKEFERGRTKGLLAIKKYQKKESARKQIKISEIKLTEDLCEVIGAFIGDGFFNCYNNRTYQIEFSGDSRYDLEYYQQKIQ